MKGIKLKTAGVIALAAALTAGFLPSAFAGPPDSSIEAPVVAANFTLQDATGATHELHALPDAPAIVIATYASGDPLSEDTVKTLDMIRAVFGKATYFMLSSGPDSTQEAVAKSASATPTNVPILLDRDQSVARNLGLTQTGEAVVIDPVGWKIAYRGPVSTLSAQDPQAHYVLFNAVVHVMGHRVVDEPRVQAKGTPIRFTSPN